MRAVIGHATLGYLVPRKWFRGLVFVVLSLVVVGAMLLIQEVAIVFFWASSISQSTQQLEAIIPQEVNMKIRREHDASIVTSRPNLAPHISLPASAEVPRSTAQCTVTYPQVLLFVRMPKCASTSFITLLQSLATPLSFQLHFNPSGAYDWEESTIKKEAQSIKSKSETGKLVYARHFYYTDFDRYRLTNYTYLTVIREPIDRFVSSYLYYHFSSKRYIQRMLKPQHKNESLMECIVRKHNGCAPNWLTKYFCGHKKVCQSGNGTALAMAKDHMEHHFAAVGFVEDMKMTLKVFAKVVPGYFSKSSSLPQANKNERSMQLSVEELEAVRRANAADIELHAYAKKRLQAMITACHIQ